MTQSNQRRLDQSRHEDYWAKRWAAPLGKYLNVQDVRTTRPNDVATPPDVTFHVRRSNGNETTTWGEITDVYYDETAAHRRKLTEINSELQSIDSSTIRIAYRST